MENRSLLIHTCCAPCVSHVYELFANTHYVSVFYYNPNIWPRPEYDRRLAELVRYAVYRGFALFVGDYDNRGWTGRTKKYRYLGERSERCWECYRYRLEGSFKKAREMGITSVTTSLSISPHKDAAMINRIGKELEEKYGIRFLEGDYKKNDGYRKSVELSRIHGFYRQNYCGCIYSKMEREGDPAWKRRVDQSLHRISS
ncbi:MAG: epoxyqueuosine reductase QueH [Spirochaetes bacterium]|nr:epoxyqueuosine reductase QueH [Spirochaetota bacterium]